MNHLRLLCFPFALSLALAAACSAPEMTLPPEEAGPETTSLLGRPLEAPALTPEKKSDLERELEEAFERLRAHPKGEDEHIWVGRRLAYLGRYRDAIDFYDSGLALHPQSYRLLRHRGHRWITLREFDRAIADLSRAAELIHGVADEMEPDGQPNERGVPTSSNHSNIYYHLGLAYYLRGSYEQALSAWRECQRWSRVSDDMTVANAYWLHLTLSRLGRQDEVRALQRSIPRDPDIIENHAYWKLVRLFKGELMADPLAGVEKDTIEFATLAYGLGAWDAINDREERARQRFEEVVRKTNWAAFGHIAAESELARGL